MRIRQPADNKDPIWEMRRGRRRLTLARGHARVYVAPNVRAYMRTYVRARVGRVKCSVAL